MSFPLDGRLPRLVIVHVMKCAGSTLIGILQRAHPQNILVDKLDVKHLHDEVLRGQKFAHDYSGMSYRRKNIIIGHFTADKYDCLVKDYEYKKVTWMRDPCERMISHWNFLKFGGRWRKLLKYGNSSESMGEDINEGIMNIVEFAKIIGNYYSKIYNEDLEQFDFIGFVENFEESLEKFKNRYDLKKLNLKYKTQNVHRKEKEEISEKEIDAIKRILSKDYKLYQKARSMWE